MEQRQAAQGGAPASGGSSFGGATSSAIEREGGGVRSRPEAAECAGEEDKVEERKRKEKKEQIEKEKIREPWAAVSLLPAAWARTMTCAAERAIVLV